jgi:hypothetical protein
LGVVAEPPGAGETLAIALATIGEFPITGYSGLVGRRRPIQTSISRFISSTSGEPELRKCTEISCWITGRYEVPIDLVAARR